jgi:RNA polymerase sigma-70 factor (ECF subfamily)
MVAVRMDHRLAARVDPSDVVQDVLAEATRNLSDFLRKRPLPFYPWLRRLAWQRLVDLERLHIRSKRRSVRLEERHDLRISDESAVALASRLVSSGSSPSGQLIRAEMLDRVRAALARLDERDREVLVLRYLEQLSTAETAAVLAVSEGAVKSRLMRALLRLRGLLDDDLAEDDQ